MDQIRNLRGIRMDLSIFLAKLIGLYLLIVSLLWLLRRKEFEAGCKDIVSSKGLMSVTGVFNIVFGLAIVLDHTVWEWNCQGLITLIGYIMIVKGVARFAFPQAEKKFATRVMTKGTGLAFVIMLLAGAYLTYCGFSSYINNM